VRRSFDWVVSFPVTMLFYVLFPIVLVASMLALLLQSARRMSFPFSLLNSVPIQDLDERLLSGVFFWFTAFVGTTIVMTLGQVALWPDSERYFRLNVALILCYVVPLLLFNRGLLLRTITGRVVCSCHLVFMCVGSYVSGQPSVVDVMFHYYALPVMFGNMAIISSEAFAFAMLLTAVVFLGCADWFQWQGPQWFHFESMKANSRWLPLVLALVGLMQLAVKHLSAVYKTQRLAAHFVKLDKEKVIGPPLLSSLLIFIFFSCKDDFVRTVTHEIKSPLHGVIGCAQLLAQSCNNLTPEQRDQVSVISHSSAVLNLLVDNVLSHGHEGMRSVRWERTPLPLFFADLLKLLQNLSYPQKGVFSLHLDRTVPATAVIPCSAITQVMLNLGMNAMKHAGGTSTDSFPFFQYFVSRRSD
jgi:hypothetical protein